MDKLTNRTIGRWLEGLGISFTSIIGIGAYTGLVELYYIILSIFLLALGAALIEKNA